jgi:hypothetical protein
MGSGEGDAVRIHVDHELGGWVDCAGDQCALCECQTAYPKEDDPAVEHEAPTL